MSTLSGNYCSLGDPLSVQEVVELAAAKKPYVVFLMEMKVSCNHAERIAREVGF